MVRYLAWLLLSPTLAFPAWSPADQKMVREFNETFTCPLCLKGPTSDRFFLPIWDNLVLAKDSYLRGTNLYPGRELVTLDLGEGRNYFMSPGGTSLPFTASFWRNPKRHRGSRPLAIYLPGVFQSEDDSCTYAAVGYFLRAGYDLLVIPNSLSSAYLTQFPVAPAGTLTAEAVVVRSVLRSFLAQARPRPTSVHLVGASYGALLGSVVAGQEANLPAQRRLITGQVTLLFPPASLLASAGVLDGMIERSRDASFTLEGSIGGMFQGALVDVLQRYRKLYRKDREAGFLSRQYTDEQKDILEHLDRFDPREVKFRWVLEKVGNTRFQRYADGKNAGQFLHWYRQARKGGVDVRVLSTKDDWLNPPFAWLEAWEADDPSRFLFRETGGHAGIVSTQWLETFLLRSMAVGEEPVTH